MNEFNSDALVFFGASGDLSYKKIFPALQALVKRGHLDVPVIGVAKSPWTLDQLRMRAQESLEKQGGVDRDAFRKLSSQIRYVSDEYGDAATNCWGRVPSWILSISASVPTVIRLRSSPAIRCWR